MKAILEYVRLKIPYLFGLFMIIIDYNISRNIITRTYNIRFENFDRMNYIDDIFIIIICTQVYNNLLHESSI